MHLQTEFGFTTKPKRYTLQMLLMVDEMESSVLGIC